MNEEWRQQAACVSQPVEIFFPRRGDTATTRIALSVCATCPVIDECLDAHINEREGIYGGTTGRYRRTLRARGKVPRRRTCLHCGTLFHAKAGAQRICSEECKVARHRVQKRVSNSERARTRR